VTAPAPTSVQQPVALLYGPGQRIVHGNQAFVAAFGRDAVGLPAREALVGVPGRLFEVVDRVLATGRPLACWLEIAGEWHRLTVVPHRDIETGEVYGAALRLAARGSRVDGTTSLRSGRHGSGPPRAGRLVSRRPADQSNQGAPT
jgi:hypothetical protein